jgi:hypothetical protein
MLRLRLAFLLLTAIMLASPFPSHAEAEEPCPDSRLGESEWSSECFETLGNQRRVKKQHRRKIRFDRRGFATIRISAPIELVAINRKYVVAIPGIYFGGENDYPLNPAKISRFEATDSTGRSGCGYFDFSTFRVTVPPAFDNCHSFRDGSAAACRNCVRYCSDPDCHVATFIGGDSLMIFDRKGRLIGKPKPLALENACGDLGAPEVELIDNTKILKCPPDPVFLNLL